jgi:hypothetical protein
MNVRDWRKFVPPASRGIRSVVSETVTLQDRSKMQLMDGAVTVTIVNGAAYAGVQTSPQMRVIATLFIRSS